MKTKQMLAMLLTGVVLLAAAPLSGAEDLFLTEEEFPELAEQEDGDSLSEEIFDLAVPEETEAFDLEDSLPVGGEEPGDVILILPEDPAEEALLSDFIDGGSEDGIPDPSQAQTSTPTPTPVPAPTSAPEQVPNIAEILGLDRAPYLPPVSSPSDGFQVEGLEGLLDFPTGSEIPFTVTGASAITLFGGDLMQADCRWSPIYWTLDGYSTRNDLAADTSVPVTSANMTLRTDMSEFHEPGEHKIRIYFRLFTWKDGKWSPYKEVISYALASYVVKGEGVVPTVAPATVTPTPKPTAGGATPTPTPVPGGTILTRDAYIPDVSSPDEGFKVTGFESPIELAAGVPHDFTVTGASAETLYTALEIGDGKWSPEYWTDAGSDVKQNYDESDKDAHTTRTWTVRSKNGIYNSSQAITIALYFRLYVWNGSGWSRTTTVDSVMQPIVVAKITPVPTLAPAKAGSITLDRSKKTLYKNSSKTYRKVTLKPTLTGVAVGKTVKYKSSDTTVATVSSKGVVTAVKKGTATITAYVKANGTTYKATCKITVKNPSLTLPLTSWTLSVGEKFSLSATPKPAATLDFSSTNKAIATVSTKGIVTGKKAGTCEIVVTANGVSKRCKIIVQ